MSRFDFKGEIFQELLAQAKKDANKGELMELEAMAGILGYTSKDVARALANRFRDSGVTGKDSGAILRYGVLIGWYAAMAKGPREKKPPWWKHRWLRVGDP